MTKNVRGFLLERLASWGSSGFTHVMRNEVDR